MAEHHPNHDPFEEAKFVSPFVSPRLSSETKWPLPLSFEPEPCPSGHPNIILDDGRDSTLIMHDGSFEKENFCAIDMLKAPTLETKKNSAIEHESFFFETPHISCSRLESLEFVVLSVACCYEEDNHPSLLVSKLFHRMVVDVFVYHKYCRSHSSTVVLTLQLEQRCFMLGGKAGNYTTIDSCKMKFPKSSL
jgi:hypothetical protein